MTASQVVSGAAFWLWMLVPITFPIYLFGQGDPQVSSYLVVVVTILVAVSGMRLPHRGSRVLFPLICFVWYVSLVNLGWAVVTEITFFAMIPLYYIFNALALALTLMIYAKEGERFFVFAERALVISIIIQVLALFLIESEAARKLAFFNNPNQLGYFALASAAMFLTLTEHRKTSNWYRGAVLSGCLFMVLVSASFAALGGFILLAMLVLRQKPLMALVAAIAIFIVLSVHPEELFLTDRIGVESEELEGYSFWTTRGYDRIANHPEQIILGSGEGNPAAYESLLLGKHEIHSSYGALIFGYGIVGTFLFALLIYRIVRMAGLRHSQFLFPVLLYGVAHQGLRSTMLWILMGVIWCVGESVKNPGLVVPGRAARSPFSPLVHQVRHDR